MSKLKFASYTIEHDGVAWILSEGHKKRGGRPGQTRVINPSYHGSLHQVAKELVDRELATASKHVTSIGQLVDMVTLKLSVDLVTGENREKTKTRP